MSEENIQNDEQNIQQQETAQKEAKAAASEVKQEGKIDEITELKNKNSELNDKILRLAAELENTRRRAKEDLEKSAKFAISNFATDLTTVTEHLFLACNHAPKEEIEKNPNFKNFADAVGMTKNELLKVLEKNKVKRIYPLNEKFDHNFHEAISQIESDAEEGTVVNVIQAGYSIADRLIRPALVTVAK